MKKFLMTTMMFGALALPAMAADLAPVSQAPVWTWTGFYFGGSVGGGWLTSNSTEAVTSSFCNPVFAGCSPALFGPVSSNALVAGIPGSLSTTKAGFLAGAQVGYNWQFGRYVLGVETDLSGTGISGSSTYSNTRPIAGFPGFLRGRLRSSK